MAKQPKCKGCGTTAVVAGYVASSCAVLLLACRATMPVDIGPVTVPAIDVGAITSTIETPEAEGFPWWGVVFLSALVGISLYELGKWWRRRKW